MKTRRTRIYVAGPYSKPDPTHNVHVAVTLGQLLLDRGYVPFVPHVTHLWQLISPNDYETWMDWDFEWLRTCDAVLRLAGDSPGADREVALANSLGIPVFHKVGDLTSTIPTEIEEFATPPQ